MTPPISHLVALYLRMAPAEARILVRLAERIDQGRTEYGSFDPMGLFIRALEAQS